MGKEVRLDKLFICEDSVLMSMLWDPTLTVPARESTVQLPTRVRAKLNNPFNVGMAKRKEEVVERKKADTEVWAPTIPTFVSSPPSKQDKAAKARKPEAVGTLFKKVARRRLEVMDGQYYFIVGVDDRSCARVCRWVRRRTSWTRHRGCRMSSPTSCSGPSTQASFTRPRCIILCS